MFRYIRRLLYVHSPAYVQNKFISFPDGAKIAWMFIVVIQRVSLNILRSCFDAFTCRLFRGFLEDSLALDFRQHSSVRFIQFNRHLKREMLYVFDGTVIRWKQMKEIISKFSWNIEQKAQTIPNSLNTHNVEKFKLSKKLISAVGWVVFIFLLNSATGLLVWVFMQFRMWQYTNSLFAV